MGLVKTDVASGGLGDKRTRSGYVPTREGFALDDARIGVAPLATRGVPAVTSRLQLQFNGRSDAARTLAIRISVFEPS